jgi:SAM-dependent methyltransferase
MAGGEVPGYGPSTYGDRIADVYDAWLSVPTDGEDTAAFLAALAGSGPALELAIGTGRIALPLAARGVEVHGIDASEAMVAKLREKPGGSDIPVTMGDMADVGVDGTYPLIYLVFNTFYALLAQEDQVRCLENVAAHLSPGGAFVVQGFVPDMSLYHRGSRAHVLRIGVDDLLMDLSTLDVVEQRVSAQHLVIQGGRVTQYPVELRYVWPAELDLMARVAGLRRRERWSDWKRTPFTSSSGQHISVYELAG